MGRQEDELAAFGRQPFDHAGRLVGGEVVGHHDLAGLEGGDELLFHTGLETGAVHGTVQHPRHDQAVVAEAGDEG